ncbi:MAG: fucose isomerase [Spirochaetales bacterium]|nr:fucose isomerase [Spirochaetales bacterium]
MLKGIPSIISPELLKIIMEMGHGDTIVFGDANFPAVSCAKRLVRADGHNMPELLAAVLKLFPLDQYSEKPAGVMEVVAGDPTVPVIWEEYKKLLKEDPSFPGELEMIPRFDFYEKTREAYAVVSTGESALYANVILTKGVIAPE